MTSLSERQNLGKFPPWRFGRTDTADTIPLKRNVWNVLSKNVILWISNEQTLEKGYHGCLWASKVGQISEAHLNKYHDFAVQILISLQQISWIEVGNYPIFTSKNGKNMNELKRTNIGHYRNYRDVYFFQAGVLFSIWRSRIVSLFHCRFTHFLVYF